MTKTLPQITHVVGEQEGFKLLLPIHLTHFSFLFIYLQIVEDYRGGSEERANEVDSSALISASVIVTAGLTVAVFSRLIVIFAVGWIIWTFMLSRQAIFAFLAMNITITDRYLFLAKVTNAIR